MITEITLKQIFEKYNINIDKMNIDKVFVGDKTILLAFIISL